MAGRKLTIHSTARTMLSKFYKCIDTCNLQALRPPSTQTVSIVLAHLLLADAHNTQGHFTREVTAQMHIVLLSVH